MKNNIFNDKEISRFFEKDADGLTPDAAIRERLEYTFLLKSSASKVNQNSFLGIFSWLLSWSHLPAKAIIVSVILLISLFKIPTVENQFLLPTQDTTYNAIPLHIDSSETSPFFADTCLTSKSLNSASHKSQNTFSAYPVFSFSQKLNFSAKFHNNISIVAPVSPFLPRHPVSRKSAQAGLNKLSLVEPRLLT